jgi:hypothetical protein
MQAYQFLMNSVAFEEIEEVQLYYTGCGRETGDHKNHSN